MNIIGEILKAAVERCRKINDDHQTHVNETTSHFNEHLGKPWKFRAESIKEALKSEEEPEQNP